jgi:hypothetical protein
MSKPESLAETVDTMRLALEQNGDDIETLRSALKKDLHNAGMAADVPGQILIRRAIIALECAYSERDS